MNPDDTAFEDGARAMKRWVREMLDRYAGYAADRGDHLQAQLYVYAMNKVAELPVDRKTLES